MNVSAMGNNKNQSEIVVLPESDEKTLCVTLKGVVTLDDYKKRFYDRLKTIHEKNGGYNLLINYDESHKGWDKEAAEMSFQSIIDVGKDAKKLAYVNAPDSKMLQVKISRPILGGEIRFFEKDELDKAIKWIKA